MRYLALLLLVSACSAESSSPSSSQALSHSVIGKWEIAAVDGRAPVKGHDGRPAMLVFDEHGYGGYAGCNAFGGQGLAHEARYYAGLGVSTAMACGQPFDHQERYVVRLLASAPNITWTAPDRLTLTESGSELQLVRIGPLPKNSFNVARIPLLNSVWSFGALDGRAIDMPGASSGPTLEFKGDRFSLETPCLTTVGTWTQTSAGSISLNPDKRAAHTCNPASREQSEAWATAMRGNLRYSNGANGEIVLAGNGHWMAGTLVTRGVTKLETLSRDKKL